MSSEYGGNFYSSDEEDNDYSSVGNRSDSFDVYDEFDKFKIDEAVSETTSNILALSGPRIYALNAYEIVKLVEHDSNIEWEFLSNINSLHSLIYVCDKAVETFHIVNSRFVGVEFLLQNVTGLEIVRHSSKSSSDYKHAQQHHRKMTVPDSITKNIEDFFQLKQVRFVVFHFTRNIRKLSNEIIRAVKRVEASKGAENEVAKKDILKALIELEKCADQVKELETTLKDILQSDRLKQLRKNIGWDSSEISDTLDQALHEIVSLEKKQREAHIALQCHQGKLMFYNNLISATQKHLPRSHSNIEAKERITQEHKQTIAEIQQAIEQVTLTGISPEYVQWLHWWTTTGNCEKNDNLIETEGVQYCDSFIFVRTKGKVESMNGVLTDRQQKRMALDDLVEMYRVFHSKYSKAKDELTRINDVFKSAATKCQSKIRQLLTIDATKDPKPKILGEGWMLVRFIVYIELFIKSTDNENVSTSSPFYAILSAIKTLVETDVQLLSNEDSGDRFIGGKRLKKQAAFLLNYAERMMYL